MSFSMRYNGNDLSDILRIHKVEGRGPFLQEITRKSISGRDGSLRTKRRLPERILNVHFKFLVSGLEGMRERIDELNRRLYTDNAVPIIFSDEPDVTYFGEYAGEPDWEEKIVQGQGAIPFVCYDPYKYGDEVTNKITVPGDPDATIVTLFAGQASGAEYNISSVSTQPIFDVTFSDSAKEYSIKHRESVRELKVIYDFRRGDKLTLDATLRRVKINNEVKMPTLTMSSAWFDLRSGNNNFEVSPEGNAETKVTYRPRWL